jgi:hypothetical protein
MENSMAYQKFMWNEVFMVVGGLCEHKDIDMVKCGNRIKKKTLNYIHLFCVINFMKDFYKPSHKPPEQYIDSSTQTHVSTSNHTIDKLCVKRLTNLKDGDNLIFVSSFFFHSLLSPFKSGLFAKIKPFFFTLIYSLITRIFPFELVLVVHYIQQYLSSTFSSSSSCFSCSSSV